MKNYLSRQFLFFLAFLLSISLHATTHNFAIYLDESQVATTTTPPASTGNGIGSATFDDVTLMLTVSGEVQNLFGMPTSAHVHIGAPGASGGVIVALTLTSVTASSADFGVTTSLTAMEGATLIADGYYVNIHTTDEPSGEVRGQVLKFTNNFIISLDGAQVPSASTGTGMGVAIYNADAAVKALTIVGNFTGLSGGSTTADLHEGAVGVTGASFGSLTIAPFAGFPAGIFRGSVPVTAGQITSLLADEVYINITSSGFAGGDIRGQIIQDFTLPVELADFQAKLNSRNGVNLSWKTFSETNSKEFVIQRSLVQDKEESFKDIGNVNSFGNSIQIVEYQFYDAKPIEGNTNYYRLKQVDFDGEFEYSEVKSVWIKDSKFEETLVLPNPVKQDEEFSITFFAINNNSLTSLKIFNSVGALVYVQEVDAVTGKNEVHFGGLDLATGSYFVTITEGGVQREAVPLMILK